MLVGLACLVAMVCLGVAYVWGLATGRIRPGLAVLDN